ncbi:MAG: hypothetical protein OHK0015_04160 [Chloroflexi bacterium OHK40]
MPQTAARLATRAAQLALAALATLYLVAFVDHAVQLLGHPFPLDYGEGPLLAQVQRLAEGTPIWRLYANPQAAPFLIVNYPPLYLLAAAAMAPLAGSALLAGRVLSLLASLACVAAIAFLARPQHVHETPDGRRRIGSWLLAALLLTVPIVREWSALMRVDLLGVGLGLWGLLLLTRMPAPSPGRALWAGLLLLACLYTKPSLIAAPAAAACWLGWQVWRAPEGSRRGALAVATACGATLAIGGLLLFGALQWASEGWFALHVVAANANRWEPELARGFWAQQLALRGLLALGATLAVALAIAQRQAAALLLPGLYTLFGAITAAGVGKVGAYSNYFIELYAGLVWLVAAALSGPGRPARPSALHDSAISLLYALLAASLWYYPPLWDATRLRPAGLIEPSPPRLAFGRYGLWADAARERAVLAALARVGEALNAEVRAAGPLLFTDLPGVAAAAGVDSRLQAFEARQLLDQGLADEDELLRELANGELPLAVIDYLGNWLTPAVIEIIQRRYAHDGALGTNDLYRPVETGPWWPVDQAFEAPDGSVRLVGASLAPPPGELHEPGELLALGLRWQHDGMPPRGALAVVVQLTTPDGVPLLESERPLLYGVYPPARWPAGAVVEHLQPLALPAELPPGSYALAAGLRRDGRDLRAPVRLTTIAVADQGGTFVEQAGHFVPARLQRAWAELGGTERAGLPLTPAVPFAWGRLQCFERVCLELRGNTVVQRPLGVRAYLAETTRGTTCVGDVQVPGALCPAFTEAPARFAELGNPLSGELTRNGWRVQWTEYARLERQPEGGPIGLGRLGDESLRLPPGTPYRWP